MNIYNTCYIQPKFNGKLMPLSEYKGPILKLTKADKAKITKLQKELAISDIELAKLNDLYIKNLRVPKQRYYLESLIQKLEAKIEEIQNLIKEIKINRLNIQKNKERK